MQEGPGLTCLYKDGVPANFEAHEVEQKMREGWSDHPAASIVQPEPEFPGQDETGAEPGEAEPLGDGEEDI